MDFLPKDPAILVSSVTMLLRDEEFDTLESLCYAFNKEPRDIKDYLYKRGFVWSEQQKQFRLQMFHFGEYLTISLTIKEWKRIANHDKNLRVSYFVVENVAPLVELHFLPSKD